jgi:4-hydroxymandelate oxidase
MPLPTSVEAMEETARERLSSVAYNYFYAGSFSEASIASNVEAWSRWWLLNRIGVDVSTISTATTVLGTPTSMPVMLAPCGFNKLAHPEGEFAVARACAAAGTIQVLSSASNIPPAEVAAVSDAPKWFQLYCDDDPAITDERLARAADAGFVGACITVDTPMLGTRYRGLGDIEGFFKELAAAGVTDPVITMTGRLDWNELERITSKTTLPIVLKGVLHPEDARIAPNHGAKGVIVSNHGGRQLDGSVPPALALPAVVEAAGDALEVYVDGGVRTGIDVLRALALGARAVLVGRPYLWALALDGEAGVLELLQRFQLELTSALALAGQPDASSVDRSVVVRSDRI